MSQLHGNNVSSSSNKEKLEEDSLKVIGPALPPHLINKVNSDNVSSTSSNDDCSTNYSEETHISVIGPILPPNLLNKVSSKSNSEEAQSNIIGPSLPPHILNKTKNAESEQEYNCEHSTTTEDVTVSVDTPDSSSNDTYGPALPPHLQRTVEPDSDDEDSYGPLPPGVSTSSLAHQALEERALQIKLGRFDTNETKATVREEWMMELPEVRAGNLGLGPRQFRKNERPDFSDRSSWTDTPEQKRKKLEGAKPEKPIDLKKEAELQQIIKHDDEQSKLIEKHSKKKKRDKSLLEMHQDELKKKKKEDEKDGTVTRRPFNREIDLKVNQFDDAQKKSIMKKAMHLDDRFSRGQSKFL
ncbi:hypothetical protein ILUMI_03542 [Ignelater luminosus]|uniref:DUF3752 domain-containing protein n=1 Tax=Ignelater luminosus TaxID=2038154 RepID=A0A8K0GFE5_IGNLU|nr:hypothetical protein ILUMI_03542 [Ignelater luminosus]